MQFVKAELGGERHELRDMEGGKAHAQAHLAPAEHDYEEEFCDLSGDHCPSLARTP